MAEQFPWNHETSTKHVWRKWWSNQVRAPKEIFTLSMYREVCLRTCMINENHNSICCHHCGRKKKLSPLDHHLNYCSKGQLSVRLGHHLANNCWTCLYNFMIKIATNLIINLIFSIVTASRLMDHIWYRTVSPYGMGCLVEFYKIIRKLFQNPPLIFGTHISNLLCNL
jgi:hypothetical protein